MGRQSQCQKFYFNKATLMLLSFEKMHTEPRQTRKNEILRVNFYQSLFQKFSHIAMLTRFFSRKRNVLGKYIYVEKY